MALVAPGRAVRSLVVRDDARLAGIGIGIAAAGRLGGIAVIASWIPARAATKADPLQAFRG
jgi:hypothetical protein